jgi:hypothetical protein
VDALLALRPRLAAGPSADPAVATPGGAASLYAMTGSGSTWFLLAPGGDPGAELARVGPAGRVVHTETAEHVVAPEPIE